MRTPPSFVFSHPGSSRQVPAGGRCVVACAVGQWVGWL
jgi:hypothetical protein